MPFKGNGKTFKKNNLYQIYLKVEIVLLSQKKIHYNTEQNARILREMENI